MATHYGSHPRLHSSVPLTQSLQHLLKVQPVLVVGAVQLGRVAMAMCLTDVCLCR